ncbi:MAG: hypothetical protein HY064_04560 [Bacteroidetes bacterium]|nr:hypothetical protein [Bacteroidota bacterium]
MSNPPFDQNYQNWNQQNQNPPQHFQNPYQPQWPQPPYPQNPLPNQNPYLPPVPPYNPYISNQPIDLQKAVNAQVCGIIGLILFWNIIGIVLNICAIIMGAGAIREIEISQQGRYNESSYRKAKAAKTCGIIGLCLFGFMIIAFVIFIISIS